MLIEAAVIYLLIGLGVGVTNSSGMAAHMIDVGETELDGYDPRDYPKIFAWNIAVNCLSMAACWPYQAWVSLNETADIINSKQGQRHDAGE